MIFQRSSDGRTDGRGLYVGRASGWHLWGCWTAWLLGWQRGRARWRSFAWVTETDALDAMLGSCWSPAAERVGVVSKLDAARVRNGGGGVAKAELRTVGWWLLDGIEGRPDRAVLSRELTGKVL